MMCVTGGTNGILTDGGGDNKSINNSAENNQNGITFNSSVNSSLITNIVTNNNVNGISLINSSHDHLEGNSITGNSLNGIYENSSDSGFLINNTIARNVNGVIFENSNDSIINGNLISDQTTGNAIALNSSYSNVILNNTVSGNNGPDAVGIYLNGSGDNLISNNWFSNNDDFKLEGLSHGNIWNISKTGPETNIYGGLYQGGNYWAQPNGLGWSEITSDRGDGFGVAALMLDDNNYDYLPLTNFTPKPIPPKPIPQKPDGEYTYRFPWPNMSYWGSKYIEDTFPDQVSSCRPVEVSVTFENNGTVPWTYERRVALTAEPGDEMKFTPTRIELEPGTVVNPGEYYTFNFTLGMPCNAGPYNLRYRMTYDGSSQSAGVKFGDVFVNTIIVTDGKVQQVKVLSSGSLLNLNKSGTLPAITLPIGVGDYQSGRLPVGESSTRRIILPAEGSKSWNSVNLTGYRDAEISPYRYRKGSG